MAAYVDQSLADFVATSDAEILAQLHRGYAEDGFVSQYTSQTISWEASLPPIKQAVAKLLRACPRTADWQILLELPLYRLRRRVDLIVVSDKALLVIEIKVGAKSFEAVDRRQVEEYAMDLRDFHEHSADIPIAPALWCTDAPATLGYLPTFSPGVVEPVIEVGKDELDQLFVQFAQNTAALPSRVSDCWVNGVYKPVPSVIEAATSLFAGHGVEEIARADAANLDVAAERIVAIIDETRSAQRRALVFLTGVPGSGKTLAGLQVVHRTVEDGNRVQGDVVYLSGNTPLVTVLREALTEDEYARRKRGETVRKGAVRSSVRARIQHIIDFLQEYLSDEEARPPHEHAIVFDEAQRAWDASYGKQKFGRSASEPVLLLEIMGRHEDWSVIVGLIGGGQEINTGENGIAEWGDALRSLPPERRAEWSIYGPPEMALGDQTTAHLGLGELPGIATHEDENLTLRVPLRSFRSPLVADWVAAVIDAQAEEAAEIMSRIEDYPIHLTRSLDQARSWLKKQGRGERRFGLVASSNASRLRAEGLGVSLNATDRNDIAYWYLKPRADVRSSFALEVVANEYTTQGLELDFVGLCWGGDFLIRNGSWVTRQFRGTKWTAAREDRRRFIKNSYRVLLTRAREGLVIWVPEGDAEDPTRKPAGYDRTAEFLVSCGASPLPG